MAYGAVEWASDVAEAGLVSGVPESFGKVVACTRHCVEVESVAEGMLESADAAFAANADCAGRHRVSFDLDRVDSTLGAAAAAVADIPVASTHLLVESRAAYGGAVQNAAEEPE